MTSNPADIHPEVVVLTPVYNGGRFIREAMESVQAQIYPNLRHFVLDNASTDDTGSIIAEFAGRRVPVAVQRNPALLDIAQNWNRCVELGLGGAKYMRILCADDTMPPESIAKMVALAERDHNIRIVACQRATTAGIEEYTWAKHRNIFDGAEIVRACFLEGAGFPPPHILYRCSLLGTGRAPFDETILAFDTDAAFSMLTQPEAKFAFSHEPLGFTRRHDDSVTSGEVHALHTDYFDWLMLLDRYGCAVLSAEELHAYRRRFLRHYNWRLLVWRIRDANGRAFNWHLDKRSREGSRPSKLDFAAAVIWRALARLGMGAAWSQYPQT